jgi:acetyl-CoA acetyltransferase
MAQRICGTGFELFRQAGEQIQSGAAEAALVVGTESMTRNPIAAFDHRTGFKLGAPVGFKDYMWEALKDSAPGVNMIQTAENLAVKYGIGREEVDAFASNSFAKAVAAQQSGFLAGEIVPVVSDVLSSCAKALTLPPKAGVPVSTRPVKICRFKDKLPSLVALARLSVVIELVAWLPNTDDKTLLSETSTGKLPPLPVKEEKYVALLIGAMMSALPTWGLTHWLL